MIKEYWNLIGREPFLAITWEPDFSQVCSFCRMLMNHKNFHSTQIPDKTNDVIFLNSPKAETETEFPGRNLSSGFVEWSYAVVITSTTWCHGDNIFLISVAGLVKKKKLGTWSACTLICIKVFTFVFSEIGEKLYFSIQKCI